MLLGLATVDEQRGLADRRGRVLRLLAAVAALPLLVLCVLVLAEPGSVFGGATDVVPVAFLALSVSVALDRPWRRLRTDERLRRRP